MDRQGENKRHHVRFPFKKRISYTVMGDDFHPPSEFQAQAQTVDLSRCGLRICLKGPAVDVGFMLMVRVPVSEVRTSVPVLAEVRWVRANEHGGSHAGLEFIS
jgi:PilZ domain